MKKSERKNRVTKKFLEVSRCSRAKQRQEMNKKCAARARLLFAIVVFHRSPALLSPLSIT